ncbi:MAG: AAA family ATPase [Deltaproteobacteria bacterium]|jgi:predicted AAA+ superfamily ATPase|nr:AAA family ATPase [Deltaproteobacteria bacterium]
MSEVFKKIPSELSSFKEMINEGYVYVDKTDMLHKLIVSNGKSFFLNRPRRFGKTLLLDTLAAIFKGDRTLFAGLKISNTDYDFKKYPVLHLNMSLANKSQGL